MHDPNDAAEQVRALDDGRLLARLGEMFREAEPPPADIMELARQSFVLRALDAELATLVEDSDLVESSGVAVRDVDAAPGPRQLTFQFHDEQNHDELVIALQVESRGASRRLTGHLAPRGSAHIEVRQPAAPEARRVDVDHLGRFVIDEVRPGPVSLTCRRTGAAPVATEWTLL